MGIQVEITNVDKANNSITINQDGQERIVGVVAPAKIEWAKTGPAEIGFNPEGNANFVKKVSTNTNQGYNTNANPAPVEKKKSDIIALSSVEVDKDITLDQFKEKYNMINNTKDKKCGASNLFPKGEDKYDAVYFITTFKQRAFVNQVSEEGTDSQFI